MVLSDLQYEILEYISNHSYPSGDEIAAAFSLDSYSAESVLRFLCENGLIFFTTASSLADFAKNLDTEKRMDMSWFSMIYHFFLTESGKAALVLNSNDKNKLNSLVELSQQVKNTSESAYSTSVSCKRQADAMEAELAHAKAEAKSAKIQSRISFFLTLVSIAISIISLYR